jgi:hypothetical protein
VTAGPLELVRDVVQIFDELDIPYALGGSMASALFGEPRSTVDVDIAVRLTGDRGSALLDRTRARFYVPEDAARSAIESHSSFNLVDTDAALKVDLFVVGDDLLDRLQMDRRIPIHIPGFDSSIWVTAPEIRVLRKLDWYRNDGSTSDRQWRDVIGILRATDVDVASIEEPARQLGLDELLRHAVARRDLAGSPRQRQAGRRTKSSRSTWRVHAQKSTRRHGLSPCTSPSAFL